MSSKPTRTKDDPEESKRFIETAREIEADEDPKTFEHALRKVIRAPKQDAARGADKRPTKNSD